MNAQRNLLRLPRMLAVVALAIVATVVVACGGSDEDEPTATAAADASESPTAAATLVAAGDADLADVQEVTVRQYFEPGTLDPAFLFRIETENIAFNIYSGLTTFDPATGAPMPDLAKSWDVSDDGLEYTFHLVGNAEWQHGYGAFTSADVVYSYDRVMDEAIGSPYRAEFNNVDSVTAMDDYTVVIKLKQPDGNFLYQVGNYHQGQIVNQQAIEDFGDDYGRNPVGTGPFYIDSWTPDSEMVLLAHEGYFRGRPTLDKITWVLIRDVSAAETAFLNGEVDVMSNLGQGNTELIDRVAATEGVQVATSEDYATFVTMFGSEFEPFQNRDVRLAYALAVDWGEITEQLTPRTASPWSSILPPWMPIYNRDLVAYGYDPERAKELLAGAGYADGFTVHQVTTGVNDAGLLEQAMLAEVGIDMQFEVVEPAVYNQRRNAGDFELAGRLYPAVNPDTLLFGFLHPDNAAPAGLNGSKYDNPDVTRLLEEARASLDPEERLAKYYDAQQLVYDDVAYMTTRAATNLWASGGPIKNIQVNRLANVDFYPVYVAAGS